MGMQSTRGKTCLVKNALVALALATALPYWGTLFRGSIRRRGWGTAWSFVSHKGRQDSQQKLCEPSVQPLGVKHISLPKGDSRQQAPAEPHGVWLAAPARILDGCVKQVEVRRRST